MEETLPEVEEHLPELLSNAQLGVGYADMTKRFRKRDLALITKVLLRLKFYTCTFSH